MEKDVRVMMRTDEDGRRLRASGPSLRTTGRFSRHTLTVLLSADFTAASLTKVPVLVLYLKIRNEKSGKCKSLQRKVVKRSRICS